MELADVALNEPAWEAIDPSARPNARRVLETICEGFGGVLVGPGRLVRHLVDEGAMGHRSVLDALAQLVAYGLLRHRRSDQVGVFWVPDRLIDHSLKGRQRPPRPDPRRNGGPPVTAGSEG